MVWEPCLHGAWPELWGHGPSYGAGLSPFTHLELNAMHCIDVHRPTWAKQLCVVDWGDDQCATKELWSLGSGWFSSLTIICPLRLP